MDILSSGFTFVMLAWLSVNTVVWLVGKIEGAIPGGHIRGITPEEKEAIAKVLNPPPALEFESNVRR